MKRKIVQYKARSTILFRKWANWSSLSYIGRNPVSKLIIFAPLVAHVLVHKPQLSVFENLDLQSLHWAYWSLISFSLGQLVYTFKCPSDIKAFPNRHDYIGSLDSTETNERLRVDSFENIRSSFVGFGGTLEITDTDVERIKEKYFHAELNDSHKPENETQAAEKRLVENYEILYQGLKKTGRIKGIDWIPIYNNLHIIEKYITQTVPEKSWVHFYNLQYNLVKYALSEYWRVNLLDRRYEKEKLYYAWWRGICLLLYAVGMFYFVYSGIRNVFRVLETYIPLSQL